MRIRCLGVMLTAGVCLWSLAGSVHAKDARQSEEIILDGNVVKVTRKKVEPTLRDVVYGPHARNKLDFWKAASADPTPLVFYIHGGGWGSGSKEENKGPFLNLLQHGVSYVSINYRLARDDHTLPCSLHDAARALQFVRTNAGAWNIDPDRIIAVGGSAGGCSSLWLAYHDDLANPDSDDPVERQSSRVLAAAVINAQTTIDPWLVDQRLGPSASGHSMIWRSVGATSREDLFAHSETYEALWRECSPLTHVSKDDPPVFLIYGADTPAPPERNGIHHVEFGRILLDACDALGLSCTLAIHNHATRQAALDTHLLTAFGKAPSATADTVEPADAATGSRSLTEFAPDETSKIRWNVVNDGVMGGLSQGRIANDDAGILRFRGDLSLENNGGFSSIRTTAGDWNLADQAGIALRVRGDGRTYQFRLESDALYRGMPVSFSAEFPTTPDQWVVVHLPFADFRGGWRGRDLPEKVLNPGSIRQLGVLLGDKQEGPFAVEIDWIRTFGPSS